ncbi:MAG: hypothetical protein N2560_01305 [Ignavibacteria bacterium]|nr:hypothetical protein [Ignavibacteria bacterium]
MEESKNYRIIKPLKKEISDDILFKSKQQEEFLYRKQLIKEILQRIRISIETNDIAFWKTFRSLLGAQEENNIRK